MKYLLIAVVLSFSHNVFAGNVESAQALLDVVGAKQVACNEPNTYHAIVFFVDRTLKGDLNIVFFGGELTGGRESYDGYQYYVKDGSLFFDVGDDSPHDMIQVKLSDLKNASTNPRARITGLLYPSDETPGRPDSDPKAVDKLECNVI